MMSPPESAELRYGQQRLFFERSYAYTVEDGDERDAALPLVEESPSSALESRPAPVESDSTTLASPQSLRPYDYFE